MLRKIKPTCDKTKQKCLTKSVCVCSACLRARARACVLHKKSYWVNIDIKPLTKNKKN